MTIRYPLALLLIALIAPLNAHALEFYLGAGAGYYMRDYEDVSNQFSHVAYLGVRSDIEPVIGETAGVGWFIEAYQLDSGEQDIQRTNWTVRSHGMGIAIGGILQEGSRDRARHDAPYGGFIYGKIGAHKLDTEYDLGVLGRLKESGTSLLMEIGGGYYFNKHVGLRIALPLAGVKDGLDDKALTVIYTALELAY